MAGGGDVDRERETARNSAGRDRLRQSEIGGTNAPAWYRAEHRPGTVNSDWQGSAGYHDHTVDLLVFAHKATGQVKYLEPMKLKLISSSVIVPRRFSLPKRRGRRVTANLWKDLAEGRKEWIAARLAVWLKKWGCDAACAFSGPRSRTVAVRHARSMRWKNKRETSIQSAAREWPLVTSECIATDRVHWLGMGNAFRIMTGYGVSGEVPAR